jgi:uncharacterized iron-regulated membrane protein
MSLTTFLSTYLRSPRQLIFRRIIFQVHLWMGLGLGLYLLVMSLSGIALVFEDEIAAAMDPQLYHVREASGPHVTMDALIKSVRATYPNNRIWRIYAPTTRRDTYLFSLEETGGFRTVFAHPATGAVVGELPRESFMATVWSVHANLTAGDEGRRINCTLGLFALVLFATGLLVWWPGASRWWHALGVNRHESWQRVTRRLHGAVGIWTFAFVVMFAATGALYFYGPTLFKALALVSVRTNPPSVWSDPALDGKAPRPSIQQLIAQAQATTPDKALWAVFPPMGAKSPVQVVLGPIGDDLGRHAWDWDATENRYVYFDQYSGQLLAQWDVKNRTAADFVRSWIAPLHRGSFDGFGVKILWAIIGLAPSLLFVAAVLMWWNRVLRPWLTRRAR